MCNNIINVFDHFSMDKTGRRLTILLFPSGWKAFYGTPIDLRGLGPEYNWVLKLSPCKTIEEAVERAIRCKYNIGDVET